MDKDFYLNYDCQVGLGSDMLLLRAISFISGDEEYFYSEDKKRIENEEENYSRLKSFFDKNKNKLSYEISCKDICEGKLKITKYENGLYFVKLRELIPWCLKNSIQVDSRLKNYFNYQFWFDLRFWKFNEAISIISSDNNPPFPSEVIDAFETNVETFDFSNEILKFLGSDSGFPIYAEIPDTNSPFYNDPFYNGINFGEFYRQGTSNIKKYFIDSHELLKTLDKHNIDLASDIINQFMYRIVKLDKIEDNAFERKLKELSRKGNIDGESYYDKKVEYQEWIDRGIIDLEGSFKTISGISIAYFAGSGEKENYISCHINQDESDVNYWLLKRYIKRETFVDLFYHDERSGKIDFIIDKKVGADGALYGSVKLNDFINWANSHGIEIPPKLKESKPTLQNHLSLDISQANEDKKTQKNPKTPERQKNEDEKVIFELECIKDDLHYSIVKIFDYRIGKEPVFVGKKFKNDSEHGKFITTLCKKIGDKECIDINPSDFNLTGVRSSKVPNIIFKEKTDVFRPLFFEGTVSDKRVVFYKKITKKRLEEKGLLDKI